MKFSIFVILNSFTLLVALGGDCSAAPGITSSEVLLGQSAAFTGSSGNLGAELWRGAQAYFDSVNAHGGIHGRKIRVLSLDDKYDGDLTLMNTLTLINDKKVFALFGYVGTPTLVKALPAIQRYSAEGIFLFSDFTGAQPQREPPHEKYVFNVRASYRQETKALVDHLVALGNRRIGVFIQDDSYGRSGSDGVQRALKDHGLLLSKEVTYSRGAPLSTSMAEQAKLLAAENVQAVISVGSYDACAAFIRDARAKGFEGPIANVSFVGSDALLEKLIAEGNRLHTDLTRKLVNSQVVPTPTDAAVPLVREYREATEKFSPQLPGDLRDPAFQARMLSFGGLEGFLNAKLFGSILARAKEPLTRESFKKSAESMGKFEIGLAEKVSFSPKDHQALDKVFFTTIEHGKNVSFQNWDRLK
jgi:branched-chain amino acid transport system substrate-binding protein